MPLKLTTYWPISAHDRERREQLHTATIPDRYGDDVKIAKTMYDDWVLCAQSHDHDWWDTARIALVTAAKGLSPEDREIKPTIKFE